MHNTAVGNTVSLRAGKTSDFFLSLVGSDKKKEVKVCGHGWSDGSLVGLVCWFEVSKCHKNKAKACKWGEGRGMSRTMIGFKYKKPNRENKKQKDNLNDSSESVLGKYSCKMQLSIRPAI